MPRGIGLPMPFAPTIDSPSPHPPQLAAGSFILKSPARIIDQTMWKTMNIEWQSKKISVFAQTMEQANPARVTYHTLIDHSRIL
jgi:hypothetical protein